MIDKNVQMKLVNRTVGALNAHSLPTESVKSVLVPTKRLPGCASAVQAYVGYAALVAPPSENGHSLEAVPSHWWAIDALSGALLAFNDSRLFPWVAGLSPIDLPGRPLPGNPAETLRMLATFESSIWSLGDLYFSGQAPAAESRSMFLRGWNVLVPAGRHARLKSLAPDFFEWLGISA